MELTGGTRTAIFPSATRHRCYPYEPFHSVYNMSSLLRIACRNRTVIRQRIQWRRYATTTTTTHPIAVLGTTADEGRYGPAAALALAATAIAYHIQHQQQQQPTQTEARRKLSINNPKAANLSRFHSLNDRGMSHKYKVDWQTVLGEGAYGSVHPARLAATGEKVSVCESMRVVGGK